MEDNLLSPTGRVKIFHEQNGGSDNCVCGECWIFYSNGACREKNVYGALCPPPKDPRELARKLATYWRLKLDLAVEEFDQLKNYHLQLANVAAKAKTSFRLDTNSNEVVSKLKGLKEKVKMCRKKLHEVEEQLDSFKPKQAIEVEQRSERNRELALGFAELLEDIEI